MAFKIPLWVGVGTKIRTDDLATRPSRPVINDYININN